MTDFEQIVARVLDLPPVELSDDVGPATHANWTSLRHFLLVSAIEDSYGLSFSRDEIRSIRSVGDVRRMLVSKGASL